LFLFYFKVYFFFYRHHNEKSLTIRNRNLTNYQNKFAVEKQVKYCIILGSGDLPFQTLVQILNYYS